MTEPEVHIAPPRWFAGVAVAAAALGGGLGLLVGVAAVAQGSVGSGLLTVVAGVAWAAMTFDVSGRRVDAVGDELVLRQWYRELRIPRDDIEEFDASRASLFRWDIVALRTEAVQVRLWATRVLTAGRRTREGWLAELERWRTWVGEPG
ncbi:MAG: hypothetical protein R2746_05200 [Acidimicrobiales bacterium]